MKWLFWNVVSNLNFPLLFNGEREWEKTIQKVVRTHEDFNLKSLSVTSHLMRLIYYTTTGPKYKT